MKRFLALLPLIAGCAESPADLDASSQQALCASQAPLVIEVVIDAGSYMAIDDGWATARAALVQTYRRIEATADPNVHVGAIVTGDHVFRIFSKVDPQPLTNPAQVSALIGQIDDAASAWGAEESQYELEDGYDVLRSETHVPQARRMLVWVNDGTFADPEISKPKSLAAAKSALTEGIQTYVLGIDHLSMREHGSSAKYFHNQLAIAGGSAPPGCDYLLDLCHTSASPGVDPSPATSALVASLTSAPTCQSP